MKPSDLEVGDKCDLSITVTTAGTVSRAWTDEKTGSEWVALRTPVRTERVFRVSEIQEVRVHSRGNAIPGRVGP